MDTPRDTGPPRAVIRLALWSGRGVSERADDLTGQHRGLPKGQDVAGGEAGEEAMSTGTAEGGLTTRQAATLLDVSIKTVQKWVSAGRIRAERITPPAGKMYLVLNKEDVEQVRRERATQTRE